MKRVNKFDKLLIVSLVILTLFRILLAVKTPLYLQAGAGFDDFLMIDYAKSILKGHWLGQFGSRTLAKGVSFPIFIVVTCLLGIPYSLGLILLYISAILLFIVAIKKYINNKFYLTAIYLILLYSPVMFHIENVQKIYRGGVIVSVSLLVISALICMYNSLNGSYKKLLTYSIIASICLPFFYYLKEDSLWIIPFSMGSVVCSLIVLFKSKIIKKEKSRLLLVIMPLIALVLSKLIYCSINYIYYGEFSVTDRNDTYFKNVMADIIRIEEKNEVQDVWITKNMMYKAIDSSKTLQSVKKEIDDMYSNSWAVKENGEIEADIIYWTFKEAMADAGIYKKGGKYVNSFYKKIDKELVNAYKSGKLKKSKKHKIYLSSIAIGYTIDDIIDYYPDTTKDAISMLVTYSENETGVYHATGPIDGIVLMDYLTNSETVWPEEFSNVDEAYNVPVSIINGIVFGYQKTGMLMFVFAIVGLMILTFKVVKGLKHRDYQYFSLWIILLGLIFTCGCLLVGVIWFCSCFNVSIMRHIYNYSCGIVPLIQILEVTGIYFLIKELVALVNNHKIKKGV